MESPPLLFTDDFRKELIRDFIPSVLTDEAMNDDGEVKSNEVEKRLVLDEVAEGCDLLERSLTDADRSDDDDDSSAASALACFCKFSATLRRMLSL